MTADPSRTLWFKLVAAGLIADSPVEELGGGNADRDPARARSSWLAQRPDGSRVKLTVGADLADYRRRLELLSSVAGDFVPQFIFAYSIDRTEVIGETFIAGNALNAWLNEPNAPLAAAAAALARLIKALAPEASVSADSARLHEWEQWKAEIEALTLWDEGSRAVLRCDVFPTLWSRLESAPPRTRVIHGDFIGSNILIDEHGPARLIDPEFALETHFWFSDVARFYALTPGAERLELLLKDIFPRPDPEAFLFFWLEQIRREATANRPDYMARWLPHRLGEVRRLTQQLSGRELTDCPWGLTTTVRHLSSPDFEYNIEEARWLLDSPSALRVAGWCYRRDGQPVTTVQLLADGRKIAHGETSSRPDVQQHFAGALAALHSGFVLEAPPVQSGTQLTLLALAPSTPSDPPKRFWNALARDLPGRGPLLCGYRGWAELLDPEPTSTPVANCRISFSVLLPVYRPPLKFLRESIESVQRQFHAQWELRIVDDASGSPEISALMADFAKADSRIFVQTRASNGGIAQATNDAVRAATAPYCVFLDHDDILRPHALSELASALDASPELDAVYSDEDKIDENGGRVTPMFKPNFSPEFLRGVMYVGHVLCVRTSAVKAVGGFDSRFDGIQDYEFMLRLSEQTRRIGHVPRVLYHWRQSAGSSALTGNVKGDMDQKQLGAVRQHLERTGQRRRAEALGGHRVRLEQLDTEAHRSSVSVFRFAAHENPVHVLQRACNESAREIILLQAEHVAGVTDAVIAQLASIASLSDSGVVGPVYLSSENRILESGRTSTAEPIMAGFDAHGDGYHGSLRCNREVTLVSTHCVAIPRHAATAYFKTNSPATWAELCTGFEQAGRFNRICATAKITLCAPSAETAAPTLAPTVTPPNETFYNPHFASRGADYQLATRPAHLPRATEPIVHRLEELSLAELQEGCLSIRGWAFHLERRDVEIQINVGTLRWRVASSLPRPDVTAAYSAFTDGACGFGTRIRIPAGRFSLVVEAIAGSERREIFAQTIDVPRSAALRRWLTSSASTLLQFQLLAGPSHPPRALNREIFPSHGRPIRPLRLTIVTPSFQHGEYLAETIRSVLDHTTVNCDYLIQDGGSTDRTMEVLNEYGPRLHSWASVKDRGQADAIARAFARTAGQPDDVMAWINSDDFYMPGALDWVAAYFAAHPDVDLIYGNRVVVDEQSREIGRWYLPRHDSEVLKLNDFVPQETMFWRRRVWDKVGGINASLKFAMDWDLLLRFQAEGARIVRVPYFLACFRVHSAQKTSAQIGTIGQQEIDSLRRRTFGRQISPAELESDPQIYRYLRSSARAEWLARTFGLRGR